LKSRTLSYAARKALRETSWSGMIILIMSAGLTAGIIIPSTGSSLQSGLSNYANAVGAYVVVQNNGNPLGVNQTLPSSIITKIESTPGVLQTYPMTTNLTIFNFDHPRILGNTTIGNRTLTLETSSLGVLSAVIGGTNGYPIQFIKPVSGHSPSNNEDGFLYNSFQGNPYNLGDHANIEIGTVNFTSTEVGINSYVPVLGNNLQVLWPAQFIQHELGAVLYNQTFGGGINFLVIQARSIQMISSIVSNIKMLLEDYPSYTIVYDQATVGNLISLQNGTTPLYELIGAMSLSLLVISFAMVSYVAIRRRRWEFGLLITQGWDWGEVRSSLFYYFGILAAISFGLSIGASLAISKYAGSSFQVYGGYVHISVFLGTNYVLIASILLISLIVLAASMITSRLHKVGLDKILRDF
jgi:hypothetical protein